SYVHHEVGFGWDDDFVYRFQNLVTLGVRMFKGKDLFWQVGYVYRDCTIRDTHIVYPGLVYRFGENMINVTYAASFDRNVDDLNGGIGVMAYSDRMGSGVVSTNSISGMYSYQINVNRRFSLRAGIQMTYVQRSIDPSKMNFGDQIDPKYGFIFNTNERFPRNSKDYPDFSAGLIGFSDRFFGGVAVHHIGQPDEAFIRTGTNSSILPRKYTVHAGAVIPINDQDDFTISPNAIFQQQAKFQQLNLGLYFTKGPFVGGLWYRNKDAIIALVGFKYSIFRFGYSYDVTISKLRGGYGSHELTGSFQFFCKKRRRVFNTVNCPTF
ncbi:MAG: PorP/SprF family type IX secretion system membrane protein, partial [Bacteroidia bacterium]